MSIFLEKRFYETSWSRQHALQNIKPKHTRTEMWSISREVGFSFHLSSTALWRGKKEGGRRETRWVESDFMMGMFDVICLGFFSNHWKLVAVSKVHDYEKGSVFMQGCLQVNLNFQHVASSCLSVKAESWKEAYTRGTGPGVKAGWELSTVPCRLKLNLRTRTWLCCNHQHKDCVSIHPLAAAILKL